MFLLVNLVWSSYYRVIFNILTGQIRDVTQSSPYQAVTGKIYRLKQHFLPPEICKL